MTRACYDKFACMYCINTNKWHVYKLNGNDPVVFQITGPIEREYAQRLSTQLNNLNK